MIINIFKIVKALFKNKNYLIKNQQLPLVGSVGNFFRVVGF